MSEKCEACNGFGTLRPPNGCPCGCDDVPCEACDETGLADPGGRDELDDTP